MMMGAVNVIMLAEEMAQIWTRAVSKFLSAFSANKEDVPEVIIANVDPPENLIVIGPPKMI